MSFNKDVLAELLNPSQTEYQPEEAELIRLIYRRDSSGSKNVSVERTQFPGSQKANKHRENHRKKKATYYLSEQVLVELGEAKARIKVLVPSKLKTKVSMSKIVDYAVGAILKEFNVSGYKSDLMQEFLTGSEMKA